MNEYLRFRSMITPPLIQAIFWITSAILVVAGILTIVAVATGNLLPIANATTATIAGIALIVLGPLVMRLFCELLIVPFRIHETMRAIEIRLAPAPDTYPAPVEPTADVDPVPEPAEHLEPRSRPAVEVDEDQLSGEQRIVT